MSDLFPSLPRALAEAGQATWRGLRFLGRGLKKLGRVLLLYVLPPLLVIHIAATLITGRLVGKEMKRLADAGHPLTLAEIAPPVPPQGENAADVYQQAFDAYRISTEDGDVIFSEDLSDRPEAMAVARGVVAANERYFDLLERASRMPECVFPVDWEAGADATFPHWARMREAARMLGVRARVLSADGRTDEALADCATVFRFVEQARTEPGLIAQLVAIALHGIIVPALEETLSSGAPSPQACRDTFDQLRPSAERPPVVRAMECELNLHLWVFDYVRHAPSADVVSMWRIGHEASRWQWAGIVLYRTVGRPLLNLDQLAALRLWADYLDAFDLPWPESQERVTETDAALHELPLWRNMVTQQIFPVYTRFVWTRERGVASVRAAQVALAVAARRAERDSYPASLADLQAEGWDLPTDPFSGEPFRYRREGDGFVVWSIGPDMDDDNAARDYLTFSRETTPEYREEHPHDYDVIFRCE